MQQVHDAVRDVSANSRVDAGTDLLFCCRQVVERLGLPGLAVNPRVARSLAAHDPWCEVRNLAAIA